jgi:hypothetical protein
MSKNTCYVTLKGGIGNQLMQYSFANLLKNHGYKVKIDNRFFCDKNFAVGNTERNELFDSEFFGFENMKTIEYKFIDNFEKIYHSNFIKNNIQIFHNYIFGYFNDKSSFDIFNLPRHSIFNGYWQYINDLNFFKKYLISCLQKKDEFNISFKNKKLIGSTMLHVRRGDYLELNQELQEDYYLKAIKLMENRVKNFHFSIFTDDKKWVENQDFSKKSLNIFTPNDSIDDFSTFCKMMDFENYIIANSTYSYIAALLGSTNRSSIIYPKVWFKNRTKKINFEHTWISV